MYFKRQHFYLSALHKRPHAIAYISDNASIVHGIVRFYQTGKGVLVITECFGLPITSCRYAVFGIRISDCISEAGALPPLYGAGGEAFSVILSDRFTVNEIIGRTILLYHFTNHFSENMGDTIACGEIRWF